MSSMFTQNGVSSVQFPVSRSGLRAPLFQLPGWEYSVEMGSVGVPPAVFGVSPETFQRRTHNLAPFSTHPKPVGGTPTAATEPVALPDWDSIVPARQRVIRTAAERRISPAFYARRVPTP